jgi:hypothetical protein
MLLKEPGKVGNVEGIGPNRGRRERPRSQVGQELVAQIDAIPVADSDTSKEVTASNDIPALSA